MKLTHVLTEAKAMEEGMQLAWEMVLELQFLKVIHGWFFTPCLVRPLFYQASLTFISGSLLQDQRFRYCKFSFVPRYGNKATHFLAQYARNLSKFSSWIEKTSSKLSQATCYIYSVFQLQYASSTKGVSMHLANRSEPPSKSKTASQKEEMEKIY
ncbi:hypothetical protein CMV_023919 [Castanea mollissima]|uniref:Uncharacterized protein n=1 Tax=Castanea mollissima TaxID=60419 RepID=A0A8J4VD05_9ROSI|nr:hypothetical protein CMV_023919 [Castanea mollissima]